MSCFKVKRHQTQIVDASAPVYMYILALNPLSPKCDQHKFSHNNIND